MSESLTDSRSRSIKSGKKRRAQEAFEPIQQSKSGTFLVKHRHDQNKQVKEVSFNEDDENRQAVLPGTNVLQNGSAPNRSRLKQRAHDLLSVRQQLPIWPHAQEIRTKLIKNDVLLLVGETGSGKSTQIPQFLLDGLCKRTVLKNGVKVGGTIAITQPRRVAAISLARRVAEEMGTPLGSSSPASQVGYSVRFDSSVSPSTRIKFLTDGMLLQELLRNPWLNEYSVIVVDEVHERGVNVDLVLGFLKRLIQGRSKSDGRGGVPLKVVVMSATADMERIEKFFNSGKETSAVGDGDVEKNIDEKHGKDAGGITNVKPMVSSCFIKGRQYPVMVHYSPQAISNTLDAAMERIVHIHSHTPLPGDVLVFLPGQETIDSLESMCQNYAQTLHEQSKQKGAPKLPKLLILPLFAALPTMSQQRVFESTPPFTRKIILSTNIAETSVTVPGIRHVIDTGKRKARFFRPSLNLDTLLSKPISRSSANQRSGRAGREAPGHCYRLYTEKTFYELDADTEPEILRCDLAQLVLTLKAHNIDNILDFPLLSQPPLKSLERALLQLLRLKALDRATGQITKLGHQMSSLPLPANLARILLVSQLPQYDCLEEIIDIVSGLSVENIWLPIHNTISNQQRTENPVTAKLEDDDDEIKHPMAQARATLYRREGDHLTLLAALQAYTNENSDRKEWCRRHGISHRAMSAAMDVRKQLTKLFAIGGRYHRDSKNGLKTGASQNGRMKNKKELQNGKSDQEVNQEPQNKTNIKLNGKIKFSSSSSTDSITPVQPSSSPSTPIGSTTINKDTTDLLPTRILKTLLLGLSTNTAYLSPQQSQSHNPTTTSSTSKSTSETSIWIGPYKTPTTHKSLSIHPSSVLFSRSNKPPTIMFDEFVVTGRAYARGVSEVQGGWVDDVEFETEVGGSD